MGLNWSSRSRSWGFSDAVFTVIASFLGEGPSGFVAEVEAIEA